MTEKQGAHRTLRFLSGMALAFVSLSISYLYAQSATATNTTAPSASPVAFDVATIKPGSLRSDGIRFISLNISPDGQVQITNWTLKALICAAYNMGWWQVQGGPAWIEKDYFDIEAKPSDPTSSISAYNIHHDNQHLDDPQLRMMLQELLQDRFALKTHLTTKEGPIYILEGGDGELTLTPNKHPSRGGGLGGVGLGTNNGRVLINTSMASLAGYLSDVVFHQPVIDKTGLTGAYDFVTKNIPSEEEVYPPGGTPDMTVLIRYVKEMGLKLTKSTGPVTTLVVDGVSQPSPN